MPCASQSFFYVCITLTIQLAILRVYAIGIWANDVQNSNRNGVGAFVDIMYAVGDAGEMLVAKTVCNIVCGGYIVLTLGNGVFNGIRLFMCTASVALLEWQQGIAAVVVAVETPDSSMDSHVARPPPWHLLCITMALCWSQVAISVAVGEACMEIIADSTTIQDIVLNFLALLFVTELGEEIMRSRIINKDGAMGGKIVPVLKIEWLQDVAGGAAQDSSRRRTWLTSPQKFVMLLVVPLWHYLLIAIVDVSTFVENSTYAGGNIIAFTVGWTCAAFGLLLLDAAAPRILSYVQGSWGRLLVTLTVFELIGLLLQDKTSSQLTSGNADSGSIVR